MTFTEPPDRCLCPCHTKGDPGQGYVYTWDDYRGIRHEDWIDCGCTTKEAAHCTKERT